MICVLLMLVLIAQSVSQDSLSTGCKGSIINQYFGSDQHSVGLSGRGAPGPPGKRGPVGHIGQIGLKGDTGRKGQKGDPAISSTILELKRAVDRLENSITSIGHDSEHEIEAGNCEPARCYKRAIIYTTGMENIIRLIDASQHCRQYIKYRCRGSLLFRPADIRAAWVSRNGTLKYNWGGSERNYYCACGETGTCIDNSHKCNCDQNSNDKTTSDEGYLTNKDDLPVTAIQFGDLGDSGEYGWHTLGKLECW